MKVDPQARGVFILEAWVGGTGGFLGWGITVSHRAGMLGDPSAWRVLGRALNLSQVPSASPPAPNPLALWALAPHPLLAPQRCRGSGGPSPCSDSFVPLAHECLQEWDPEEEVESPSWHLGRGPRSTRGSRVGLGRGRELLTQSFPLRSLLQGPSHIREVG